jgi:teichuronic acid biosynthesis glycosyltransferase TuaG
MALNIDKELISIIIPYFKKKKYIEETIKSVINQTYENFEIILIYDQSDDNDLPYIREMIKQDNRISLIVNKKNLGAGLSRNLGIDFAKGNYIAFLDADDLWRKNKLQFQINYMKNNNIKISHTDYEIIDSNRKHIGKRLARNFFHTNDLVKSCDIGLSTVMLKKKILSSKIRFPNLKTKEDFVLWLKILQLQIPIISLNKNLSSWRRLDDSLSSNNIQKLIDAFKVYNRFMNFNFIKSIYYVGCLSLNFLKKNK